MSDYDAESLAGLVPGLCPQVTFFDEVDSTNQVAAGQAAAGAPEWSLVATDLQTGGRGRLGRTWRAEAGTSILASLIIDQPTGHADLALIPMLAGIAIAEAIGRWQVVCRLKWPNDVVWEASEDGSRKIAGILAEVINTGSSPRSVVGFGINVNQSSFPPPIDAVAASIRQVKGSAISRLELLRDVISAMRGLSALGPAELCDRYRLHSSTIGRTVNVAVSDRQIRAVALDIDAQGGLILDSGETVRAADVTHVRPDA